MTDCPTGCDRAVAPGQLLCRPCWSLVPKPIQRDVYATWRKWQRNLGDVDAMEAYRSARAAAIASIP